MASKRSTSQHIYDLDTGNLLSVGDTMRNRSPIYDKTNSIEDSFHNKVESNDINMVSNESFQDLNAMDSIDDPYYSRTRDCNGIGGGYNDTNVFDSDRDNDTEPMNSESISEFNDYSLNYHNNKDTNLYNINGFSDQCNFTNEENESVTSSGDLSITNVYDFTNNGWDRNHGDGNKDIYVGGNNISEISSDEYFSENNSDASSDLTELPPYPRDGRGDTYCFVNLLAYV